MKHVSGFLLAALLFPAINSQAQNFYSQSRNTGNTPATIRLQKTTLMHEMRATPSPLNNAVVRDRIVSLMWPMPEDNQPVSSGLDGMEAPATKKTQRTYRIRLSQDKNFKKDVREATLSWPFYNPEYPMADGTWYWQFGYVENNNTRWSEILKFTQEANPSRFAPPSYKTFIAQMPSEHPRVFLDGKEWDTFIAQSQQAPERKWYISQAEKVLKIPMKHIGETDTSKLEGLDNEVKRNALLTRESRRIVDKEEANTEVLIRAYMLTKDDRYFEEAMNRLEEMAKWNEDPNFVGDFNESALLSLCSMGYDAFYNRMNAPQKALLLKEIRKNGAKFFNHFNNHLENHIADNHVWQMAFRIFSMATYSVYGDLPEADTWADYCYNLWVARFPGLNQDGAWHNGDSYFHVNVRTLIEMPYFYSRITGYDFFSDPWYKGSAMYVVYQQPPFSKSGGNGSSHQNILQPSGVRAGYADALAKMTGNTYAADYVRSIQAKEPEILRKAFMGKTGDLAWFRLQCPKPLPQGKGLKNMPLAYVFPQSGLASFMSDWSDFSQNAMLSFRSSPYGSTSHAIANQNAFNTFYGGKPLFYSSGHHVSFTDQHSIYCHRSTRAHNTILVNGMGQRIGTEGYGWIPRHYVSKKVSYFVGDASNAYGNVISPLWLARGKDSELEYTPANGWDKNRLKTFRRHVLELGDAGLIFIYDELEADTAVTWSYLLHTTENPMVINNSKEVTHIQATNANGISDAYLFANDELKTNQTDQFFYPAINWLRADDKGNFPPYKNHWHFTATSPYRQTYRFATIISTHGIESDGIVPEKISTDQWKAGDWSIKANISTKGKATFIVENKKTGVKVTYDDNTKVTEERKTYILKDQIPELEI